jgi:hypothetical protein
MRHAKIPFLPFFEVATALDANDHQRFTIYTGRAANHRTIVAEETVTV